MLSKLLKYEFKASARIFAVVYLGIFGLCLSLGLYMLASAEVGEDYVSYHRDMVGTVLMMVTGLFLGAAVIITTVVNLRRFYQGLYRDEGYLIHTLPVQPWQILASKLIPAVVWTVATMVVMGCSLLLTVVISNQVTLKEFFAAVGEFLADMTEQHLWGTYLLVCVLGLAELAATILQVYAAISLGQMSTRRRVASAIAIWFGMTTLQGFLANILGGSLMYYAVDYVFAPYYERFTGTPSLLLMIGTSLVWCAVYWAVNQWVITRKLNLE